MGDRCHMEVNCRRCDAHMFEKIGFAIEGTDDDGSVYLYDDDANHAHCNEMPTNIPYTGMNGPGDDYGPAVFACDGDTYAEMECLHSGVPAVTFDEEGDPSAEGVSQYRDYMEILHLAEALIAAERPV